MDTVIRPMRRADVVQVAGIERKSFGSAWSAKAYYDELGLDFDYSLIAELPGLKSGFVAGYICSWVSTDQAMILKFAVHPDFRCRGIGSVLLQTSIDHFASEGMKVVKLEVRETNLNAQALYREHGFQDQSRGENYYDDTREAALIMSRNLNQNEELCR